MNGDGCFFCETLLNYTCKQQAKQKQCFAIVWELFPVLEIIRLKRGGKPNRHKEMSCLVNIHPQIDMTVDSITGISSMSR